jgi:ATP-binding cassette, subfamily B, bacterial
MEYSILKQIKYLSKYLKEHKKILIFSLVLTVISTGLGMIQPFFAKIMIDDVLLGANQDILIPVLGIMVFLLIFSFVIRVTNSYIYTRYSAKFLFKMRTDLFDHIHRLPLSFFVKTKIGDIFSRIATDMTDIQNLITATIPHYLFDFVTCIITGVILFWLNWQMALMSICFLPAALYIVYRLRPGLFKLNKKVAETNADIGHFLFESLSSASLIRSFGAEKFQSQKLEQKQSHILRYILRYQIFGAIAGSVPTIFMILNTLIVFGYGGVLVMDHKLTIGSLVAFSIYQGRVFAPLQGLLDGFLSVQKAKVSLARVRELLDIQTENTENANIILKEKDFRGEIVFKDVSFAYEKEKPVFNQISFHIPCGKTTALVGPSGAGKTTICHLILRLFDPNSGLITIDGIDLKKLKTGWLRKQIAIVSQDTFLFHTSIMENIRFSRHDATDQEIIEAAKAACIHEFIQSLANGYQTTVGERGVRLSGGQKQRISIARSILTDPKILILDEATAFLDTSAEDRLKKTIHSLMKNRTIIVVSHRSSTIQGADKTISLVKSPVK